MTIRAMSFVKRFDDRLEFWIAKELDSPNKFRGHHWGKRNAERAAWQRAIATAIGPTWGPSWSLIIGTHTTPKGQYKSTYTRARRRVEVERHVPKRANFIKDDDNLAFARKPLNDALKNLGLVCDDSRDWMVSPPPTQHVSDDGRYWTVVKVYRAEQEQAA